MHGGQDGNAVNESPVSRRSLLKATAAASALAATGALGTNFAHAQGSTKLRVGLVGCGGRGSGAAKDCAGPNDNVQIVALGDVFQERIDKARQAIAELGSEKFAVKPENCFVGFDAYQKVIASDVDLVILATPPGFRPMHIAAAVDAGKHIFAEKPVAVDPAGVRSVLESAKKIKEKKLGFVCGTQRRHHAGYIETIKRIHDGAIGDVVGGQCYWNQGGLWMHPQESWSDMEWQLRNWLYFTWLSGDHIVEQHVHNIDVMNWVMGSFPVSAYGMGGRQARTEAAYGHIFDHFAIEYVYKNKNGSETTITSMCRQQDGTEVRVGENIVGTKGTSNPSATQITGPNAFRMRKPEGGFGEYQQEHVDLIKSIRSGSPLNEAETIAYSTLTAIMGRMSAYTGKLVTWDQALNSKLAIVPTSFAMGPMPVPPVAIPGKEQVV